MGYRAFLFDLDGVITSSSREHFDAWRTIAAELGFGLADEIEESTKGISRLDSLEVILDAGNITDQFSLEEKTELAEKKKKDEPENYFLKQGDNTIKPFKLNRKKILGLISEDQERIAKLDQFMKDNKLSYRKSEDLKKGLEYSAIN